MIIDSSGNGPAISQQMMKKATILQVGQQIFVEVVPAMIAPGRVVEERAMVETATTAIAAAATYIEVATAAAEPK